MRSRSAPHRSRAVAKSGAGRPGEPAVAVGRRAAGDGESGVGVGRPAGGGRGRRAPRDGFVADGNGRRGKHAPSPSPSPSRDDPADCRLGPLRPCDLPAPPEPESGFAAGPPPRVRGLWRLRTRSPFATASLVGPGGSRPHRRRTTGPDRTVAADPRLADDGAHEPESHATSPRFPPDARPPSCLAALPLPAPSSPIPGASAGHPRYPAPSTESGGAGITSPSLRSPT